MEDFDVRIPSAPEIPPDLKKQGWRVDERGVYVPLESAIDMSGQDLIGNIFSLGSVVDYRRAWRAADLVDFDYIKRTAKHLGYEHVLDNWRILWRYRHLHEKLDSAFLMHEKVLDYLNNVEYKKLLRRALAAKYQALKARLVERDGATCMDCGSLERLTIDHIQPLAEWGTNDIENLRLLCHSCNTSRGRTLAYKLREDRAA